MALVERQEQWTRLESLMADCAAGEGRVALISAPVGCGKSELLAHLTDRAVESGFLPLTAIAAHPESTLPFGVMKQLLRSVGAGVVERMRPALTGLRNLGFRSRAGKPCGGELSVDIMDEVCEALLDAAEEQPLLLCVDDVHRADPVSLQCLLSLVRRIPTARVLLVLAESEQSRPALPLLRSELLRQRHTHRLRLGPLSPAGVAAMLTGPLSSVDARRAAAECHSVSGGNPALVRALLDGGLVGPQPGTGRAIDFTTSHVFGQAVLACLHRAEPAALHVARCLAVLGAAASPARLRRLCGLEPDPVAPVMEGLGAAGLVEGGRFRHPAAERVLLADPEFADRSAVALRAARLLYDEGADVVATAERLIHADRVGGEWAISLLREAAEQAVLRGWPALATTCLEAALRSAEPGPQRTALTLQLARAEWNQNPAVVARHLPVLMASLRRGEMTGPQILGLTRWLVWFGRLDEAADALRTVAGTGRAIPEDIAAEIRLIRRWLRIVCPSLLTHLDEPRPAAGRAGYAPVGEHLQALGVLTTVLSDGGRPTDVVGAEQILDIAHAELRLTGRLSERILRMAQPALLALICAGRPDRADAWCRRLRTGPSAGDAVWRALLTPTAALIALRRGDLVAAGQQTRAALAAVSPRSWGIGIGFPRALLLRAATAMGAMDEAHACMSQPVPPALFQTVFGLVYRHSRGHYHLATGHLHAALREFLACGDQLIEWAFDVPDFLPWRLGAADASLRLGRPEQARALARDHLERPGGDHARALGLRRLAMALPPRQRLASLHESVELLKVADDRFELAHSLADLSRTHQELRDFHKARTLRHAAWQLAKECHAMPLARSLLPEAGADAGAGVDVSALLTESERRVAELAAEGHSNREIADKLVVTVSTVEQHLTRCYRKLGVKRRTELMALLRRPPASESIADITEADTTETRVAETGEAAQPNAGPEGWSRPSSGPAVAARGGPAGGLP
jgi:DNA-binding CsgD family transcriptional regulator